MLKDDTESIVESELSEPTYEPSEKEKAVVSAVFEKFRASADDRNRNFEYFDGINLIQYIEDSVRRFTTNIDEREGMEDWQARVNNPFTRNKVLAILGKVVQVLPIAEFKPRGEDDTRKIDILNNLYQYAEDVDDYEELMMNVLLEAIVKGTAIGYEGLDRKDRKIKNVKRNGDNLTYSEVTEKTSRLFGSIVPLEDFYPQHVGIRNIKQMDYCFWRTVIPESKFESMWGGYKQARFVKPQRVFGEKEQRPFYADYISGTVAEGMVEVIRYYDKCSDEYVVVANGVWLNPLDISGVQQISPLPFNHKELPFWDIKFDFFGADFFYGKSLPDRLKSLQDVLNVLTNMLLDQSFLTIFPPILTNGSDYIEDDYLRPGRRTPVDTQGLPLNQAFMKLDLGTPSGWHQYILEYTQRIMEQSSLDQVSSGQAGVGGRTTAQEIRTAAEGVTSLLGLFGRFVNYGIKRKAMLKAANILQFWTDPEFPMVQKFAGDGSAIKQRGAFNTFKIPNSPMSTGKRGQKVIEMYKSSGSRPSKSELSARAQLYKVETGKSMEIIATEPSYLRHLEYDVMAVSNPKKEATRDMDKAMQLEKVRVLLSFFPDMIDREELAAQTVEKLGDDPDKLLKKAQQPAMPGQESNPEAATMMSQNPEMNLSNNMMRGMQGGEQSSMSLRDLASSMNG